MIKYIAQMYKILKELLVKGVLVHPVCPESKKRVKYII